MKRVFLLLFLIGFLCVTLASTEIKAFAFGERAFKVAYDEYLQDHVLPTVYEMTDTGRVELDDKNLGIYFIWKHWYWWNQDWKYWTDYWSETLSEVSSKRMGTAIGTLLVEGGSALLGTGITMLVGDLLSLGASLPASVKAVFEAGKLVSIALGLTSAGLNTIADTLATDKEDFISVYIAMSGVDDNSLDEARELLDVLEKKKDAIMLADSEIKLIDAMNKIMNLQASTAMLVLEPATLSTIQGLLEIIDDSLLDLATVEIAPRGIKEDVEGLNLFLNASIIHLGLLVDLSRNLDELQSEIQLAESKFDSARMASAVMRAAAIENAYYRVMAGYIRLHLKYLQKDPGVMNHIDSGLSTFRSFIKNVGYYLGSGEETMVTEVNPLPAPINLMPEDGEIDIQIIPSHGHDWVSLMWEMPDTEGRTVTYDVLAGTGRDSLTYIARDLTEKMFFYDGLQEGKEYYWKVIAKDNMENKSESPVWKFSTVKVGAFLKTPSGIEMVYVEGGPFTMGDWWGDGADDDERPTHKVTLTYDFYIGKYETTFDEYDAFCDATGKSKPDDEGWGRGSKPVINVSWWDAIAYCNWLSEKEGLKKAYDDAGNLVDSTGRVVVDVSKIEGYRLPTEAEWEYAARGGKLSKGYKYSGGDEVYFAAWYIGNSGDHTHDVGTTLPNELGIYDMSGNVEEWCSDWYDSRYYAKSPTTNPYNYAPSSYWDDPDPSRVCRGGCWSSSGSRVAFRGYASPTDTYYGLGFRICRKVPYEGGNRPPLAPYIPSPSNEVVVWAKSVTLRWDSYDPDSDTMTYDVYFDTNVNPTTKVSSNQTENTLDRTDLSYNTTYYWKVVAKDNHGGVTEGPIWKFSTRDLQPKLVFVEKGSFMIGFSSQDNKVTFTYDFYIGKYETTFDEYDAFCSATGRSKPYDWGWGRGQRPVIWVSWGDAIAYCNWLSEREGLSKAYDNNGNLLDEDGMITTDPSKVVGYRLPTAAEWEYASRGGNRSKGYKYAGSDNVDDVAWYWRNSGDKYLKGDGDWDTMMKNNCRTQEVGKKAPNELGIYDMSGNVWEWCSDSYCMYDFSSCEHTNPYFRHPYGDCCLLGGGWFNSATDVRGSLSHRPYATCYYLGFRICRTVPYEGGNRPPLAPYIPSPSNEAVAGATSVTLGWDSYDLDSDTITYDVYFDTNASPKAKVSSNQVENTLNRSNLSYDTTYYWKVVAKDNKGATTEGPVWEFTTWDLQPTLLLVEKSSFTMGDTWGDGESDEKPTHEVTFTYNFYIGKYETTFDEYDAFCETTDRSKPGDSGWGRESRPVINVTWWDAIAYCNWLSEKEKLPKAYDSNGNLLDKNGSITTDPSKVVGYRLPTEAEWEYAARGGNKSKGYKFSGSDNVDEVAWYWQNSGDKYLTGGWDWDTMMKNNCKTQEVGEKSPNELGIYDMSGNVWEWCSDWYEDYSSSAQTNPHNNSGSYRVYRGGGWGDNATCARVAGRRSVSPASTSGDLGFRICRTVPYEGKDRPPLAPYNPNPSDNSTNQLLTMTLSWDCSDPDGDAVTYDVYFGTNSNPPKVSTNQSGKTLNRSNLSAGTTYYWKAVAKDSKGATTEGPVWRFIIQEWLLPQMVLVEKGSFTMGDTWGDGADDDERPTHKVTLTYDFYIGKYETTFDEYDAFCEATGRSKFNDWGWGRGTRPVIFVSWWDAIAYCNWLSQKEGLPVAYRLKREINEGQLLDSSGNLTTDITQVVGYRLPTEAEWEYAARGGVKSKGYKYSGSDNIDEVAWYTSKSGGKTQEVGKKAPNELGLYDMSGNVWEWCSDWWDSGYYSKSPTTNPYNSTAGSDRVRRGGGWGDNATYTRVANRVNFSPTITSASLGFRIARTVH